ncbi:MAG: Xaa-Pro dipeptidase [Gammaproteobacteria bacterium]|nr:Xaa-Pro dipeptidase [Gammaproteobacteria bacterium]
MHLGAYNAHIDHLTSEWRRLMDKNGFDAAAIYAGQNQTFFGDDQEPPFHAYGHFLRWVPQSDCEHAVVVVRMDEQPVLLWHTPSDYWYLPSDAPDFAKDAFDVQTFADLGELRRSLDQLIHTCSNVAHVGKTLASTSPTANSSRNDRLVRQLDYQRAYKTEFEQLCMKDATALGVLGHQAAARAFSEGESEYQIHHAFLRASSQHEAELPYPSIVAMNTHAATLHYQKYDREPAPEICSLLIDAGAKSHCYHSDITRTYAANGNEEFAELIDAVDHAQRGIIEVITIGKSYLDLHEEMSQKISEILTSLRFLTCSPATAYESMLVDAFFPHGLGHLLGLQTHDVGGRIVEESGREVPPHNRYESLRLLRSIEPNMIFTIEPGIYFIPSLLDQWRGHQDVNWTKVDRFTKYGGVRVEDNVFVSPDGPVNLTRNAFSDASVGA